MEKKSDLLVGLESLVLEIQLRVGEKIGGAEKLQRLISPFAPEAKSEVLKGLDKSAATFLGYFSSGPLSSYVGELFWGILEKTLRGHFLVGQPEGKWSGLGEDA